MTVKILMTLVGLVPSFFLPILTTTVYRTMGWWFGVEETRTILFRTVLQTLPPNFTPEQLAEVLEYMRPTINAALGETQAAHLTCELVSATYGFRTGEVMNNHFPEYVNVRRFPSYEH